MGDVNGDGVIDFEEFVHEAPIQLKHRLAGYALAATTNVEQHNTSGKSVDGILELSMCSVSSDAASSSSMKSKKKKEKQRRTKVSM